MDINKEKRISILLFLMVVFFLIFSFAWNGIRKLQSFFYGGFSYFEGMAIMLVCAFSILLVLLLIKEED